MKPDQYTAVRNALLECEEILDLQVRHCHVDPQYGAEVEELGERIGYGALMTSASASWEKRLLAIHGISGGAHGVAVGRMASRQALRMVEEALKVLSSLRPRKARRRK